MTHSPPAEPPTLAEFLAAPIAQVAAVAPETIVYAQGGTRRAAALAGISTTDDAYARWSQDRMVESIALLFRYGVRNIFTIAAAPSQFAEVGPYRERLTTWIAHGLAGTAALERWRSLGWRVRLVGVEDVPELHAAAAALAAQPAPAAAPTVWWYISASEGAFWPRVLAAAREHAISTQAELITALYGEPIPPARLCLSFGKPLLAADVLPLPLFTATTHCYWLQRPGYSLDDSLVRRIWYDFKYLRATWRSDKTSRYTNIAEHAALWERGTVLGLGRRVGDFWYPDTVD
jgi:hypothetical protein